MNIKKIITATICISILLSCLTACADIDLGDLFSEDSSESSSTVLDAMGSEKSKTSIVKADPEESTPSETSSSSDYSSSTSETSVNSSVATSTTSSSTSISSTTTTSSTSSTKSSTVSASQKSSSSSTSKPKSSSTPGLGTTYEPEVVSSGITLISFNSNLVRNQNATITVKGKPNTKYTIKVYYSSGASTAEGLEDKFSDANGVISWTWHVGGRTKLGNNKKIEITGGGDKYTTTFAVID